MRIGIIGAMDIEIELLRKELGEAGRGVAAEEMVRAIGRDLKDSGQIPADQHIPEALTGCGTVSEAGMEFFECALEGVTAVVVQSGVGMVNAASCAQVLIDRFAVDAIINTGVAGSLDASIDIGDFVVAADAVNWAMDVCNLGYDPGQTPGMELAFPADVPLGNRVAQTIAAQTGRSVFRGRVASADRFVRDQGEKLFIADTFGALCCEMEGAAIAQVCFRNQVPCAIVRAISDKADGSDAMDYPAFEERAARESAAAVMHLLRHWTEG